MNDHDEMKQWYLDTVTATVDSRALSERDRDYVDLKQWTAEEEKELKRRKQPITQSPELKENIETIIGVEIQSRVDIKAFPRTPNDEQAAEAATDSLRYIADNADFDQTKTECAYNLLVEGRMAAIVEVEQTKKGFDIAPRHIPWDRFFIDPRSTKKNGKDARFMGQAIWLEEDVAKAMFPNVDESLLTAGIEEAGGTDTYDDKPKHLFMDSQRKRIKLIEMYYLKGGKWMHCIFTALGYVVEPRPSPYIDEDGDPMNPIEVQAAFIDRDNNAYGFVRQLVPMVDEVNKRRSKSLHLLSARQIVADKGAVDNINKARLEFNKPDGYIEKNPGKEINVSPTGDLAQGQFQLLLDAKTSLNSFGGSEALSGGEDRSLSGRAYQLRQQASIRGLSSVLDGLRNWEKRMYRQMWMRVRQFWTEEKWIRVTDDENNLKFVALNRPITLGEQMQQEGQLFDANDPRMNQVVGMENPVGELDVDIILDTVPDMTTVQTELFEAFSQGVQASGQQVPLEMWLELMPHVPHKRRLLETLKGGNLSPEEQAAQQEQQEKQQRREDEAYEIEKATKLADIREKLANAAKDRADAEAQNIENAATESGITQLMERINGQAE